MASNPPSSLSDLEDAKRRGRERRARLNDAARRHREECQHVGHEWADAGGGLMICMVCQAEQWGDPRD